MAYNPRRKKLWEPSANYFTDDDKRCNDDYKVIALPEQFSYKQLQVIADGDLEDATRSMREYIASVDPLRGFPIFAITSAVEDIRSVAGQSREYRELLGLPEKKPIPPAEDILAQAADNSELTFWIQGLMGVYRFGWHHTNCILHRRLWRFHLLWGIDGATLIYTPRRFKPIRSI